MPTPPAAPVTIPTFGPAVPQKKKLSKAEVEEIKALGPPIWDNPRPVTWCKHRKLVAEEANEWVKKSHLEGMYKTPKHMQKHLANNVSDLLMVVMVDSGEREAVLLGKFTNWGLTLDDFFDPDDDDFDKDAVVRVIVDMNLIFVWCFPDDPRFRANLVLCLQDEDAAKRDELLKYVDAQAALARQFPGAVYDTKQTHPLVRGFGEIWTEVAESAPRQFLLRWSIANQRFINSYLSEINIRKALDGAPSLEDYIVLRRETFGYYCYAQMCEYCERKFLPYELSCTPEWTRVLDSASDIGGMVNDFCSLQKEAAMGDVHNIVIVVQREQKCSFREAWDKAWQMFMDRIDDMERDFQALKLVTPPEYQEWVQMYLKTFRNIVRGTWHWYVTNNRYKV